MSKGKPWKPGYRYSGWRLCPPSCPICKPTWSGNWAHNHKEKTISDNILSDSLEDIITNG